MIFSKVPGTFWVVIDENYDFLKSTGYFLGGLIDENINFQ